MGRIVCLAVVLLVAAACTSAPPPSSAVGSQTAGGSADEAARSEGAQPEGSIPLPSFEAVAREPLPQPELETPEEIGLAISTPTTRLQGVVSLLHQLGIGTYTDDGEPIVPGAEGEDGALWLTESEVHAVAEMAAAEHPLDFIDFRDWHAALEELGLDATAEELVAAYEEAYFSDDEGSFFVNALFANGLFLDPDGELTHLHAWLLLLDGFVVGAQLEASVVLASFHRGQWGGASQFVPQLLHPGSPLDGLEIQLLLMRLEPLLRATPMWFEPASLMAHEGHDGPGADVGLTFRFAPFANVGATLDLGFILAGNPRPAGLPVSFVASDAGVVADHGEMRDPSGADPFAGGSRAIPTDGGGSVRLSYTPIEEEADGEGELSNDHVTVTASVPLREIARHTYALPEVLYQILLGDKSVQARMELEWHEGEGLRVEMTDTYDVTIDLLLLVGHAVGTDTFSGFLALQEDGTWRGIVQGSANGTWSTERIESCSTPVSGTQELLAIAEEFDTPTDEGGVIGIQLYPIAPPQITQIGCDFSLSRWQGDTFDDPTRPRGSGIPPQDYAPFNDLRVTDPVVTSGVPAPLPESGTETITWTEFLEGLGGGTWTVTVERVEPED
jgi:hypothetical protein